MGDLSRVDTHMDGNSQDQEKPTEAEQTCEADLIRRARQDAAAFAVLYDRPLPPYTAT